MNYGMQSISFLLQILSIYMYIFENRVAYVFICIRWTNSQNELKWNCWNRATITSECLKKTSRIVQQKCSINWDFRIIFVARFIISVTNWLFIFENKIQIKYIHELLLLLYWRVWDGCLCTHTLFVHSLTKSMQSGSWFFSVLVFFWNNKLYRMLWTYAGFIYKPL